MKIIIFRNYKEECQLSMKGYADCLSQNLKRKFPHWYILDYYPKFIDFKSAKNSLLLRKSIDFFNRYFYYPHQIKKMSADVYHIIDQGNALFLKKLDPNRTIVTCHDIIPLLLEKNFFPGIKKPPLALKIFKISMKYIKEAKYIFADSENTANDLLKYCLIPKEKIIKIINSTFYPFQKLPKEKVEIYKNKFKIDTNKLIILNVGNNNFYKNIPRLLTTLNKLPEKIDGKDWLFYHIGPSYNKKMLEIVDNSLILKKIHQLGTLDYNELEFFYNIADLLFFPSIYEGFGMPVLEAMKCGLAVLCSDIPPLKEIGNDAVVYADPYNIEEMKEKLIYILKNEEYRKYIAEKGFERAKSFNWNDTIESIASYYKRIAEQ